MRSLKAIGAGFGAILAVTLLPATANAAADICRLATAAEVEAYRGLGVVAEGEETQGNANSLREMGAGDAQVWTCDYRFVDPPPEVFGDHLSLSVFTGDLPDVPFDQIYAIPADYIVIVPVAVGDEGYWMYDDDSIRGGIAPLVNPLWSRVGDCWFEFTGDLGAEHPEDAQARGLLALAQTVADRLAEAGCVVTAEPGSGSEPEPEDGNGGSPGSGPATATTSPAGGTAGESGEERSGAAGGVVAGPPTIVRTRAFNDLRTPGTVDTGDLIFFVFSEAMDVGIDRGSTLTVLDGDGTLADLTCGSSIDCTFIVEGDVVDGVQVGNAQAMGMVVEAHSDGFRTHRAGDVPGLQYPLTVMTASAHYTDQQGFDLDVVSGDRVVENEGADTATGGDGLPWLPIALAAAALGGGALLVRRRLLAAAGR